MKPDDQEKITGLTLNLILGFKPHIKNPKSNASEMEKLRFLHPTIFVLDVETCVLQ